MPKATQYVRELIRKDQDRSHLSALLLQGAESAPGQPVNRTYFDTLRDRVQRRDSTGSPGTAK